MLTGLGIGNFKAFAEEQHIPIRPLTLIFGANSSGKSSIIHSLLLANHAMRTGNWDVHQPRLGTESVDLGGFPHFAHQHRPDSGFTLHLEGDLSQTNPIDLLVGVEAERAPFSSVRRFGLSLRVGRSAGAVDPTGAESELAIQTLEIAFDGRTALGFVRTGPDAFCCNRVDSDHPLIGRVLLEMSKFARAKTIEDKKRRHRLLSGEDPVSEAPEPEAAAKAAGATMLREQFVSSPDTARLVREVAELSRRLAEVMAERRFMLKEHRLSDEGPDGEWNWAGWREQVAELGYGGVLGFFRETVEDELRAQAQAIRYNLTRLVAVLTALRNKGIRELAYLGPQRVVPPRHLLATGQDSSGSSGCGLDAWRLVCSDACARETVNRWFGPGWLQLPYRLSAHRLVHADQPSADLGLPDLAFDDPNTKTRLSHRDLGFGVTQVMPVLVNAAALKNRIIAVEQPELHLHPAQQAELGDVFIESALGEQKNTFLLETHSEHLILRIMRRIRDTANGSLPKGLPPVRPQDVAVVFVDRHRKEGRTGSFVRTLELDDEGQLLDPWPGGFFEEGFRERFS